MPNTKDDHARAGGRRRAHMAPMPNVHPTANIDPTAHLAPGVSVGPYCVIGPRVSVGGGTRLLYYVTVQQDTEIGRENVFYPYSLIGGDPQDRKYRGERTLLRMGDRNQIRELATIHRGTANGGGETIIGSDCLIMATAHVAHDCRLGDHITIANAVMLAGHIRIEHGASIGGGAGLHHFTTVGTCAFVAGMARVPKDVPPYMLVEGSPAEPRKVNVVALTRRGAPAEVIDALKDAFRRLYVTNGAVIAEKVIDLRREYAAIAEVCHLCDSLEASARGVHGRALESQRPDDKRANPLADAETEPPIISAVPKPSLQHG
jgi:UDP-N-acetylglucosamine acyltransferase